MTPLYVCFYTPKYAEEARQLLATLDALALPHEVRAVEDRGNWQRNTQYKPEFLMAMRQEHPGRPLVWLDADARVLREPVLFCTLTCDFAAHWYCGWQLSSGTLYFGPTPAATRLLKAWQEHIRQAPELPFGDQTNLQRVVESMDGLDVVRLPASYAAIFDLMADTPDPVIRHMQASRRLR